MNYCAKLSKAEQKIFRALAKINRYITIENQITEGFKFPISLSPNQTTILVVGGFLRDKVNPKKN